MFTLHCGHFLDCAAAGGGGSAQQAHAAHPAKRDERGSNLYRNTKL